MTAASSRTAQTPLMTTPSTRRHGRPPQYPIPASRPLTPPQPPLLPSPQAPLSPGHPGALTTPRPHYWNQKPTATLTKPQRPTMNTTMPKTHEEKLRLGEKLGDTLEGNQIDKRPRGRDRSHGHKRVRGRRLRAGSVRLISADHLSDRGRVEIFIRGEWGTVCDDLFTKKAGTVVCRQLGFTTALAVMKRAAFGEADRSVRILLDDVECQGEERSLLECKRSKVGKHNCSHGEDVGVICG